MHCTRCLAPPSAATLQAFVTERAQRAGRANAASGRIMVSIPNDHFGPIGPEHDPSRGRGVLVGDHWRDRLDCRQWGAHFPHVAGIAGQSGAGAQVREWGVRTLHEWGAPARGGWRVGCAHSCAPDICHCLALPEEALAGDVVSGACCSAAHCDAMVTSGCYLGSMSTSGLGRTCHSPFRNPPIPPPPHKQSVVLSGGYKDDRDEGEWFLYTGSGGRDLSGNKRTSNEQSFDQEFDKMNKALLISCTRGLPVGGGRVVACGQHSPIVLSMLALVYATLGWTPRLAVGSPQGLTMWLCDIFMTAEGRWLAGVRGSACRCGWCAASRRSDPHTPRRMRRR
jgi:hypothetical protein